MAKQKIPEDIKDRLVADLADCASYFPVNEKGEVKSLKHLSKFQELIDIFQSVLTKEKCLDKMQKTARCYLVEPETEAFPGENWIKIFKRLKNEQRVSYSELLKEADLIINRKKKTLKTQKFTLIFPINASFAKGIKSKLGQDDFEILSYNEFKSKFLDIEEEIKKARSKDDRNRLIILERQTKFCNENFSYFLIKTWTRDYSFAFGYAHEKIISTLALLIFAKRRHQKPFQTHNLPIKISTLAPSYAFIFKGKTYIDGVFPKEIISEQDYQAKKLLSTPVFFENIEEKTLHDFNQFLNRYNTISSSDIGEILDKALKSYYEASVADRVHHSVFYYWVTIESLITVRDMKYEEIKRILKTLLAGHEYLELIIDTLERIRHDFAHKGTMEVEAPTRSLAKVCCDSLIEWFLFKFGEQFSNKDEVAKYYTFIQEDNESLRTNKRIIDTILKVRRDNTEG